MVVGIFMTYKKSKKKNRGKTFSKGGGGRIDIMHTTESELAAFLLVLNTCQPPCEKVHHGGVITIIYDIIKKIFFLIYMIFQKNI